MNNILPLHNKYAYNIDENAIYVLSLSYGKDSVACLYAIKKLGLPLHRIITADVWATQDIPADFPEVTTFKNKVDKWILENLGITVEHYCATDKDGNKLSYEDFFYRFTDRSKSIFKSDIWGFPMVKGAWCNSRLKMSALKNAKKL